MSMHVKVFHFNEEQVAFSVRVTWTAELVALAQVDAVRFGHRWEEPSTYPQLNLPEIEAEVRTKLADYAVR